MSSRWPELLTDIASYLRPAPRESQLRAVRTLEPEAADSVPFPDQLGPELRSALASQGIDALYRHQRDSFIAAMSGCDVVVTTRTASGKTLCFNLPVIETALREPSARALYLYPTKALGNDQLAGLERLSRQFRQRVNVAVFTGDTSQDERARIASNPPSILIANPDILHYQQLARHTEWEAWWSNLRFIVVDEAHVYRGVFGSHVAHVIRRAVRIAAHYGASPRFISASATIGNPEDLVGALTGRRPKLVDRDGSPRNRRDVVVWDPPIERMTPTGPIFQSVEVTAAQLLAAALMAGKSCIAFAPTRPLVERIRRRADQELRERKRPDLLEALVSYRAGYDVDRRREIESDLRHGRARAVVSTVALELGVDIGSLDIAILAGYPGSTMSFWQQAGRAGRRDREALILMVVSQNPLDQYLAEHPDRLIDARPEDAAIDASNPMIASGQLACAARELRIRADESDIYGEALPASLELAAERGLVARERRGWIAVSPHGQPDEVSIRSIEDVPYALVLGRDVIGEIGSRYIPREAHPGAIYAHDGVLYRVESVRDLERTVTLRVSHDGVLTNALGERRVTMPAACRERTFARAVLAHGPVGVIDTIRSYYHLDERTRRPRGGPVDLERPMEQSLDTEGIRLRAVDADGAAIHALEHLVRAMGSLVVLCDPADLEGHTELEGEPTAYVYDRVPGGSGLTGRLFERFDEVLTAARDRVGQCRCREGCPSCIQSGRCMRRNEGLDKAGVLGLLRQLA